VKAMRKIKTKKMVQVSFRIPETLKEVISKFVEIDTHAAGLTNARA